MKRRLAAITVLATWASVGVIGAFAQRPQAVPARTPPVAATERKFNFTPKVESIESDGYPMSVVLFQDGQTRMQVNALKGWKVTGSPAQMYFENPAMPGAQVTLRASSLPVPEKFDEGWIEATKALLLGSLPKDSNGGKIVNVAPNVFNVKSWTSIEFKEQFDVGGKRMAQSWLFIRLADGRMLEVVFSSREDNFAALRGGVLQMLAGWGMAVPAKT